MKRLALAVLILGGAACKPKVDNADFEARIKKRTEELGLNATKVTCPGNVEAKQGASFTCTVDISGKPYEIVATVTKVEGKELGMDTQWKNGEAVLSSKLEAPLAKELGDTFGAPVTIACGDPVLFLDAQRMVRCDLTAGSTKAKVALTFDDKLSPTDWKLEPALLAKAKLEQTLTPAVREKTNPNVNVTCGSEPLVVRPADGIVHCTVSDGSRNGKLDVVVSADLSIESWKIVE